MNNGKICISIAAETASEMLAAAHRAEGEADIIELRFDRLRPDELPLAVVMVGEASLLKPLIATFRPKEQGGRREISRDERLAFWSELGDGTWARDLEEDIVDDARSGTTILSFHDFKGDADVGAIIERMTSRDVDILKVAVATDDTCDAIPVWSSLKKPLPRGQQIIPIAMNDAGKWTRILGLAHGSFLTYASLDEGRETADGQVTASDLLHLYKAKELDAGTRVYGVIGDPVASSLSPFLHNPAFAHAGLNAVFLPLKVTDLDAFMTRMVLAATREVELNFAGFAVTMPHKQAIMKYLDEIDPEAEEIGAVNTVKIEGERLLGYNTDAAGFIAPLKQRIPDLRRARVAVLGSGGAARAVVCALKGEGSEVTLFARDTNKAQHLAERFNVSTSELSNLNHASSTVDLVINTTPLGMRGPNQDKTPLTADQLSGVKFVFDLVTRADETPLLREARKARVEAIGGVEMLIAQGIRQFEIWTGLEAPAELMRKAVIDRLK